MIRMIDKLDHALCFCGRPSNLFEDTKKGETRYHVEAYCCAIKTVPLLDKQRAINEFHHTMAVVEADAEGVMP